MAHGLGDLRPFCCSSVPSCHAVRALTVVGTIVLAKFRLWAGLAALFGLLTRSLARSHVCKMRAGHVRASGIVAFSPLRALLAGS